MPVSSSSPVVSITAPAHSACGCTNTIVTGDLVIDSAITAVNYVCVQPFPSLTQITGNVDFNYSYPRPTNPQVFNGLT
jgi:hypothetical protein